MRRYSVFLVILCALSAGKCFADELEDKIANNPSLGDLVSYAYKHSPMVEAARQSWKAKIETYGLATGLADPEIMFEGMYMTETLGEEAKPDDWRLSATQMLPLLGKFGVAGRGVELEAQRERLNLDIAARDVALMVKESYFELVYLARARELLDKNREILVNIGQIAQAGYASDKNTMYDVLKAQSQSAQLEYDKSLLDELAFTEKAKLNALLNRPPQAPIGKLEEYNLTEMNADSEAVLKRAEANYQEIKLADYNIQIAQNESDMASYENLPELTFGLLAGKNLGNEFVGAQMGMTLPVWGGKRAARTNSAFAEIEKMKAMKVKAVNDVRYEVSQLYFRLSNSKNISKLYGESLIPQAQKTLQNAETWYRQGEGSLTDYLEAQSAWYNFELALARAQTDYGKYLARLEKFTGSQKEVENGK